jgi:predicted nucleotidyltransferase
VEFDVDAHTIFLGLTGSHAYGTARSGSDVDLRGCCVAPLRTRLSLQTRFEQLTWQPSDPDERPPLGPNYAAAMARAAAHPSAGPSLRAADGPSPAPDVVIYDLAKLVALCAQANPNMLELLFLDDREVVLTTPRWDRLRARRRLFLSQKVRFTFAGYAQGQLRRIQGHRDWLLHPPDHEPTRAEFGLPEQSLLSADERNRIEESIAKIVRSWTVDEAIELPGAERDVLRARLREFWAAVVQAPGATELEPARLRDAPELDDEQLDERVAEVAGASLGLGDEVLRTLRQERRYRSARKRWTQFRRWQRERNPKRAALEAAHGYDTKHGMHLIRLLRMGLEILRDHEVRVRRPDARELLAIRDGELGYDELLAEAQRLDQAMRAALETTSLPRESDVEALDELLFELLTAPA